MDVRALLGAATFVGLLSVAAAGETVTRTVGPLELEGRTEAMNGPQASDSFRFERAGFITAHSVDIRDATGASRLADGLHCHSVFRRESSDDSVPVRPGDRSLLSEPVRLATSDNQSEIRFPAGFGVYVDSAAAYAVSGMLVDAEGSHAGAYTMTYRFELAPAEPPLKRLRGLLVKMLKPVDERGHECGHGLSWDVPPGRHVYEKAFVMPETARVHYISSHVHAHAREVSLVEAKGGKVLHRAPIRLGGRGQPLDSPLYSNADGLVLRKGERYVFRLAYDNPGAKPIDAMGNLRLYVRDDR